MAYDRALALSKLRFSFDDVMVWAEKIVPESTDPDVGYGMILDSAFARYGATTVAPADFDLFDNLLTYYALKMLMPIVCSTADGQVDAPLTKFQGSQICRQYNQMMNRIEPKIEAVYSDGDEYAGGYTFVGSYLEPNCAGDVCGEGV